MAQQKVLQGRGSGHTSGNLFNTRESHTNLETNLLAENNQNFQASD
jgi:hypothetical protein